MQGEVKNFKEDKGYGFIKPDSGEKDVFVHVTALIGGTQSLQRGDRVSFEIAQGRDGKSQASNVQIIG